MAQLDVSELMSDPDFVDPLTIVRRTTTVNEMGENQITSSSYPSVGSIQPADGKTVNRLPEALRVENVYSFWIKGKIVTEGLNVYPDLIRYRGMDYEVKLVHDWSNFGEGYSEGICVRKRISV